MITHNKRKEDIIEHFGSDPIGGLSDSQVVEATKKYGENKLRQKESKTMLQRFAEQFKDVMIIILIIAAAISFGIAIYENNPKEFFEPALILLIVILNAIIGVIQENKAEKALDALKNMSVSTAKVIRNGKDAVIDSTTLVPGDIIRLEAGDYVPADARLLSSSNLKVEESALTGESLPSEKDAEAIIKENSPLGDRSNMIYSGCSVTNGTALAIVTATGMNTEIGKIANLLNEQDDTKTPLQDKLAKLGKYLGVLAIAACIIIFIVGAFNGIDIKEMFMTSVSLAVSAIPEGLPAIVTIVLSIGVQRMVKKNVIIRKLPAVETLGNASVICSDKTGTLTQNKMTLVKAYTDNGLFEDVAPDTDNAREVKNLLMLGTLCCNGTVTKKDDGSEEHIGDPTETAIVAAAQNLGFNKKRLSNDFPRIAELPFDSDRKLMSVICNYNNKNIVIVKGAFDVLAKRCVNGDTEKARKINDEMSNNALRVIAIAFKDIDKIPQELDSDNIENDLTFLGLVGMIDPPRPEAKNAVSICKQAGIRPVMITGDHIITASAIAKELGIMREGDKAITGAELDTMSDEELKDNVENISVYARVSPENKIRIVKAWQSKEKVVSMTGDGVNDAPALKAADIGCAMGITGTDVAKGAADMTLTDDNFASIVDAVREGRGIYDNIRKVVGFLLGTNIGEVITVFVSMMIWHISPLLSMQLLWINLVTDSLPAIALGMEAVEADVMTRQPHHKNEGIFAHGYGVRIFLQGVMFAILTMTAFSVAHNTTGSVECGRTLAFMVLSISQIMQAYNMRSEKSLFKIGMFTNKILNRACLISVALVLIVMFTPLRIAFGLELLNAPLYLLGIGLIIVPLIVMELSKALNLINRR